MSHWPVGEQGEIKLTTTLFKNLKYNPELSRAEAFRRSMMSLASIPKTSTPSSGHPSVLSGREDRNYVQFELHITIGGIVNSVVACPLHTDPRSNDRQVCRHKPPQTPRVLEGATRVRLGYTFPEFCAKPLIS